MWHSGRGRRRAPHRAAGRLIALGALLAGAVYAESTSFLPLDQRIAQLISRLDKTALTDTTTVEALRLPQARLQIQGCTAYPYHEQFDARVSAGRLVDDLGEGLLQGLTCLAGRGPAGRLHPYHEYQAHRLLSVFEAAPEKSIRCEQDSMFATAVATSPKGLAYDDPLARQLSRIEHPGILIDTFRLGGILSQRHDDQTYRDFFHLSEAQISAHRNGRAVRWKGLHRTKNLPALLFHETVHWLGHEHGIQKPDLTHLYETCCFGGSDYIDDPTANASHQQTACRILQDDDIWLHAYEPYKQMQMWHYKGYDRLKIRMREDYAP